MFNFKGNSSAQQVSKKYQLPSIGIKLKKNGGVDRPPFAIGRFGNIPAI